MSEMIERASRAHSPSLWATIDRCAEIGEPAEDLRAEAIQRMSAAIEAMREPTDAMLSRSEHYEQSALGWPNITRNDWTIIWQEMLAGALKESEPASQT